MTAKLLQSLLNKQKNINVVDVVNNGKDVLPAMNRFKVDVLILDLEMPFMNGFEVMNSLPPESRSKVLVLSAHTEANVIEKSFEMGATGYMSKRAGLQELMEGISSVSEGRNYFDINSLGISTELDNGINRIADNMNR